MAMTASGRAAADARARILRLQRRVLGDRLDHEVRALDGGLGIGRGAHRLGRAHVVQQPRLDVAAGPVQQRLARVLGEHGRRVGQAHLEPGAGEVPGDPAAHRAAAEHGDGVDPLHDMLVPLSSGSHPSR